MVEDEVPLVAADDIEVTERAWVGGTRAAAYFGPVAATGFISYRKGTDTLIRSVTSFLPEIQRKAAELGANTVVGFELSFDPFAVYRGRKGLRWNATGTAARLERLF